MKYQKNFLPLMIRVMSFNQCESGFLNVKPFNVSCIITCLNYMTKLKGKEAISLIDSGELKAFASRFITNKDTLDNFAEPEVYSLVQQLDPLILKELRENILPNWFIEIHAVTRNAIYKAMIYAERNPNGPQKGDYSYWSSKPLFEKGRAYKTLINLDIVFELKPEWKKSFVQMTLTK